MQLHQFSYLYLISSQSIYKSIIIVKIKSQQIILKNSCLMKKVRKFFAQFDMFAVPPTLRAKEEPKASSLCSGVTSFLLALFFSYVFIINVVDIVTYAKIDSIQTESRLGSDEIHADDIFFAVRSGYISYQDSIELFDVGYNIIYEDGSNVTYPMQQCTPDQWKMLGANYSRNYNEFLLQNFYCPQPQTKIQLKKVYYAPDSQYVTIYIRPCNANSSSTCLPQAIRSQKVQDLKSIQGAIFISVYFLDQAINPNSKDAVQYFLNTDPQFSFTVRRGIVGTIEFANYDVRTDMSAFPVESIVTESGNFLNSYRQTSIELNTIADNYALIYLSLNRKHILVERTVGKIDNMLSYAGGLFSILSGFLAIFVTSFNLYRYELMVAEGVFHEDEDGNAIKERDFTFYKYIKYSIFEWVAILFCHQFKWHDCMIIQTTREEANKQMDVTRLFRKIEGLEFAVSYMMSQSERQCIALLKPQSLGRIKRNRLILEYYNSVIQGRAALNLQQYRISTQIYKFGMMLLYNEERPTNNQVSNSTLTHESFSIDQNQINYDSLSDINYLIQTIETCFKPIAKQADQVQLDDQQKQIEIELSESFFTLPFEKKVSLQEKVPIKILYRLAKKFLSLKPEQKFEEESKRKKRVVLNIVNPSKVYDLDRLQNF